MEGTRVIPNAIFFSQVQRLLQEGKSVVLPVKGYSMLPFIRDGRDSVEIVPAREFNVGDIALAKLPNGQFVLHRIWEISGEKVTLMGDGNVRGKEVTRRGDILGVAVRILKDGGKSVVECSDPRYKRKVKVWRGLLPVRRYLLAVYRRTILKWL